MQCLGEQAYAVQLLKQGGGYHQALRTDDGALRERKKAIAVSDNGTEFNGRPKAARISR